MYNLDENLKEYFEFTTGGFTYKFANPTMDEWQVLSGFLKSDDQDSFIKELNKLVTPANEGAPDFETVYKKMRLSQVKNFNKMIEAEFSDVIK